MADSIGRLAYQRPWQTDASRRLVLGLCSPVNFRTRKTAGLASGRPEACSGVRCPRPHRPGNPSGNAQPGSDPHARSTEPVYSDTGIPAVQPGRVAIRASSPPGALGLAGRAPSRVPSRAPSRVPSRLHWTRDPQKKRHNTRIASLISRIQELSPQQAAQRLTCTGRRGRHTPVAARYPVVKPCDRKGRGSRAPSQCPCFRRR